MKFIYLVFLVLILCNCQSKAQNDTHSIKNYKIEKSSEEWKLQLSDFEYYVLREQGTERAFTSPLDKLFEPGKYYCKACDSYLYSSENKYDSGSGWPSFDQGFDENIEYDIDFKIGYARTEIKCANCGSHLGHLFDDGPAKTTGKRHCINGVALKFIPTNVKK